MRLSFPALPPLAGLLLISACSQTNAPTYAAAAARPERQCFFVEQVDNFRQAQGQTLHLKVRNKDVYRVEAAGYCQDLNFATRLAIVPQLGSSRLCAGDPATIVVPGSNQGANACRVHIVKRLNTEELAALPARDRP